MKNSEIRIGSTYSAKVTNKVVPVRIEAENPSGGWDATNLHTNRPVRIKSAQRLRDRVDVPADDTAKPARTTKPRHAPEKAPSAKTRGKAAKDATPPAKRDTGNPPETPVAAATAGKAGEDGAEPKAKPPKKTSAGGDTGGDSGGMSLIDAAAHLLERNNGEAMRCQELVDKAIEQGLWTPRAGKTPANTLYAAILREIKTKGEEGRFVKAERGKFSLSLKR